MAENILSKQYAAILTPKKKLSMERFLVLPGIIATGLFTQVAFLISIAFSLLNWNLARPDLGIRFGNIQNYIYLFTRDPEFWRVLFNTIILTSGSLIMCVIFGILLAMMLNREFFGRAIVRTLILFPFFVMSTVTGLIWKTIMLDYTYGWLSELCKILPFLRDISWSAKFPLVAVILLTTWQWLPFFVLVILAGFQGIPGEIVEAAKIDGANRLRSLISIELPYIKGHIQVAIMLGLIFILKEVGIVQTLTAGGPGSRSTNLAYYIYKAVFYNTQVGRASALSNVTVVIILTILSFVYNRVLKAQQEALA
jgi:sorbitol/mannitol transport system permease protein